MQNENHVIEKSNESLAAPEQSLRVLARLIGRRIIKERELENIEKSRQNRGNISGFPNVCKKEGKR